MSPPNRYEIEIRGRASARVLHPVVDEFSVVTTDHGTTRLVGEVRDSSHLNGLLAHFAAMNVEVLGFVRIDESDATDRYLNHHISRQPEKGTTS